MTNTSSQKRPWEGGSDDGVKRKRAASPSAARDWRDVHMKSGDRDKDRRRRRDDDRDRDYTRGSGRDRRDADRARDDDRRRSKERRSRRDYDDVRRDSRARSPSRRTRKTPPPTRPGDDEEKEEGEISPRDVRRSVERHIPPPPPPTSTNVETTTGDPVLSPEPEKTEEQIIAERRARRAAIQAKYEGATSSTPAPQLSRIAALTSVGTPNAQDGTPAPDTPVCGSTSPTPSPTQFELAKDGEEEATNTAGPTAADQQINAADYDPSLDRREDEKKRFGLEVNGNAPDVMDVDDEEEVEVTDDEEDVDDMFAVGFGEEEDKPQKTKKVIKAKTNGQAAVSATHAAVDSAADAEGYYSNVLGERLDNGRYHVISVLGKGMFANVVRARVIKDENGKDIGDGEPVREVAIKIIRAQESMYKAGMKEAQILQKLRAQDPEDKKHIVRLETTFEHRGHLCLVFENLSMNLREVVKHFGKDVGLNIRAVRAYAHQLFLALSLLRKANIMHADIKPDNILVNEQKTMLKLCDLGSASDASENDITPYLVSRFYRAPEIILGVPYDPALDVWSIGCTLYELYTGKILFPGRSNNQMLRLMMELKGRFNSKMIKRAKFGETYFDELGTFESVEPDKLTGNDVVKKISIQKPTRDLRARLMPSSLRLKDEENKMLLSFVDLLDKCLMLDPARRITPREALSHPFIRG